MNSSKEKKIFLVELIGAVSISLCILMLVLNIHTSEKYTVTFNSVGGTHITSERVRVNKKVTKPINPVKEGYSFMGWYNGNTAFDFSESITSNVNLEAKWEKIKENNYQENKVEGIKDIQVGQTATTVFDTVFNG